MMKQAKPKIGRNHKRMPAPRRAKQPVHKQPRRAVRKDTSLLAATRGVIDWTLDIATLLSRGKADAIAAFDNLRTFFRVWLDGRADDATLVDVMVTFASVFDEIEIDLGIDKQTLLSPLYSLLEASMGSRPVIARTPDGAHRISHAASKPGPAHESELTGSSAFAD